MKTKRGMLALMMVPVLVFCFWGFSRNTPREPGVYIHSVMFEAVKNTGGAFEPYVNVRIFLDYAGQKPDWWKSDDVRMWPRKPRIVSPTGQKRTGSESGMGAGYYISLWRKYEVNVDVPIKDIKTLKGSSLEIIVDINNQAAPFVKTHPYRGLAKTIVAIPDKLISNL